MENRFEKSDFHGMDDKSREEALNTNCVEVKASFVYSKPLTEFEIKEKNSELNQALSEIKRLKEERKELNALMAVEQSTVSENHSSIVQGYTEVCEQIWSVNNNESGFTEKINSEGFIIEKTRFREGAAMNLFNKNKKVI